LTAFQNYMKITRARVGKETAKIQSGCSEDCMNCSDSGCARRFYDNTKTVAEGEESEIVDLEKEDK